MFSVFNFSNNKFNPNGPNCWLPLNLSSSPLFFPNQCFSLSDFSLISPSPFFLGFHTNFLSIFKSSSCHLFLSSIYTSACLDLGVSKLVTPHFFFFCVHMVRHCLLVIEFVILSTQFFFFLFFNNSGLFLATLFFFLLL